jgi:hypothetical protein
LVNFAEILVDMLGNGEVEKHIETGDGEIVDKTKEVDAGGRGGS